MLLDYPLTSKTGDPVWELATLYPEQGSWSEESYLSLTDSWNRLIELTHGKLEFLPMPSASHQRILTYLLLALHRFITASKLGEVLPAGTRIKLGTGLFREPDLVFITEQRKAENIDRFFVGADLVVEVVSSGAKAHERDYEQKVADYAAAGIAEYWIVDPHEQKITVLALEGTGYTPHGEFTPGQSASSKLLSGFSVDVTEVFAAQK